MGNTESGILEESASLQEHLLSLEQALGSLEKANYRARKAAEGADAAVGTRHPERHPLEQDERDLPLSRPIKNKVFRNDLELVCDESLRISVGPVVGLVTSTDAIILLETNEACTMTAHVLLVDDVLPSGREVYKVEQAFPKDRPYHFRLENLSPDCRYKVIFEGVNMEQTLRLQASFKTINPMTQKLRTITVGNNNPSFYSDEISTWEVLVKRVTDPALPKVDVLIHCGGQVEMQAAFEDAFAILERNANRTDLDENVWKRAEEHAAERLREAYRFAWSLPMIATVLANVSNITVAGDADIYANFTHHAVLLAHAFGVDSDTQVYAIVDAEANMENPNPDSKKFDGTDFTVAQVRARAVIRSLFRVARAVFWEYQRQLWDPEVYHLMQKYDDYAMALQKQEAATRRGARYEQMASQAELLLEKYMRRIDVDEGLVEQAKERIDAFQQEVAVANAEATHAMDRIVKPKTAEGGIIIIGCIAIVTLDSYLQRLNVDGSLRRPNFTLQLPEENPKRRGLLSPGNQRGLNDSALGLPRSESESAISSRDEKVDQLIPEERMEELSTLLKQDSSIKVIAIVTHRPIVEANPADLLRLYQENEPPVGWDQYQIPTTGDAANQPENMCWAAQGNLECTDKLMGMLHEWRAADVGGRRDVVFLSGCGHSRPTPMQGMPAGVNQEVHAGVGMETRLGYTAASSGGQPSYFQAFACPPVGDVPGCFCYERASRFALPGGGELEYEHRILERQRGYCEVVMSARSPGATLKSVLSTGEENEKERDAVAKSRQVKIRGQVIGLVGQGARVLLGPVIGRVTPRSANILMEVASACTLVCVLTDGLSGREITQTVKMPSKRPKLIHMSHLQPGRYYLLTFRGLTPQHTVECTGSFTTPFASVPADAIDVLNRRAEEIKQEEKEYLEDAEDSAADGGSEGRHGAAWAGKPIEAAAGMLFLSGDSIWKTRDPNSAILGKSDALTTDHATMTANAISFEHEFLHQLATYLKRPFNNVNVCVHLGSNVDLAPYSAEALRYLMEAETQQQRGNAEASRDAVQKATEALRRAYRRHWNMAGTRELLQHSSHLFLCGKGDLGAEVLAHLSEVAITRAFDRPMDVEVLPTASKAVKMEFVRICKDLFDDYQRALWEPPTDRVYLIGDAVPSLKLVDASAYRQSYSSGFASGGEWWFQQWDATGIFAFDTLQGSRYGADLAHANWEGLPEEELPQYRSHGSLISAQQWQSFQEVLRIKSLSVLVIASDVPFVDDSPTDADLKHGTGAVEYQHLRDFWPYNERDLVYLLQNVMEWLEETTPDERDRAAFLVAAGRRISVETSIIDLVMKNAIEQAAREEQEARERQSRFASAPMPRVDSLQQNTPKARPNSSPNPVDASDEALANAASAAASPRPATSYVGDASGSANASGEKMDKAKGRAPGADQPRPKTTSAVTFKDSPELPLRPHSEEGLRGQTSSSVGMVSDTSERGQPLNDALEAANKFTQFLVGPVMGSFGIFDCETEGEINAGIAYEHKFAAETHAALYLRVHKSPGGIPRHMGRFVLAEPMWDQGRKHLLLGDLTSDTTMYTSALNAYFQDISDFQAGMIMEKEDEDTIDSAKLAEEPEFIAKSRAHGRAKDDIDAFQAKFAEPGVQARLREKFKALQNKTVSVATQAHDDELSWAAAKVIFDALQEWYHDPTWDMVQLRAHTPQLSPLILEWIIWTRKGDHLGKKPAGGGEGEHEEGEDTGRIPAPISPAALPLELLDESGFVDFVSEAMELCILARHAPIENYFPDTTAGFVL